VSPPFGDSQSGPRLRPQTQLVLLCGSPRHLPGSIKVNDYCGDDHAAGDEPLHRFLGSKLG